MPKKADSLSVRVPSVSADDKSGQSFFNPMTPKSPGSPQHMSQNSVNARSVTTEHQRKATDPNLGTYDGASSQQSADMPHHMADASVATSPPSLPACAESSETSKDLGKTFFANYKASKSSSRLHPDDTTIRQVSDTDPSSTQGSHKAVVYGLRKTPGSHPDLAGPNNQPASGVTADQGKSLLGTKLLPNADQEPWLDAHVEKGSAPRRPIGQPSKSDSSIQPEYKAPGASKKSKPRAFAHLLGRSRSTRMDAVEPTPKTYTPSPLAEPQSMSDKPESSGLKTAPLQYERDRSFREMMASTMRNRSADRQPATESDDGYSVSRDYSKHNNTVSNSFKDGAGSNLLSNLKSSSTKAADGIGKAGKGFFGKLTRSGSSGEREIATDENYVCSTINLPLIEQTRRTRISKRLEHSKDKTEFWMPALPWRCIDYLNFKGCEEEGLYRIPGSGYKVKQWQKRFDSEMDIDLFEEPDLFDINIIGSMFKAWLRELPDEILPKSTQARIAEKCMGAKEVPQMLKDELSMLPPFNYYLLFAITCHLSLLHSYVDQNKMDYRNLCICFQPCLKMDGFCFQFLVCDWKQCWQGCWTEKEALAEEYRILDTQNHSSAGGSMRHSQDVPEERAISSSGSSSKPTSASRSPEKESRFKMGPQSGVAESAEPYSPAHVEDRALTPEKPQQLPEISPFMPLSPLGL
ncbi:MAG: hypothetical protein M1833_006401 [Piccolia ochrophora]|nr:MAG: hypothetical protein M1833_006401 [Piccolia ochrophora]